MDQSGSRGHDEGLDSDLGVSSPFPGFLPFALFTSFFSRLGFLFPGRLSALRGWHSVPGLESAPGLGAGPLAGQTDPSAAERARQADKQRGLEAALPSAGSLGEGRRLLSLKRV